MNTKKSESVSTYQQYLPAILQEDVFIGQFLLAFEKILSGLDENPSKEQIVTAKTQNPPGLEEILDQIHDYFNPQKTPEEFLPWLASWVALSLRDDWQVNVKRAFIQQMIPLYRLRGTKTGLIKILELYLTNSGFAPQVEVFDEFNNFPYYFQVQITSNIRYPDRYWQEAKIAKAIIDKEKPAQTYYTLKILMLTMQITKRSHVSYDFKLFELTSNQTFYIEVTITPSETNSSQINQLSKQLVIELQGKDNSKLVTDESPQIIIDNQSFSGVADFGYDLYLLAIAKLLNSKYSRLLSFYFHTLIQQRPFSVKYKLNYQNLQDNLEGFNVKLSNRTDQAFSGNLAIKLYFKINEKEYRNTLLIQSFNLSPVLKICRLNNSQKRVEGNTIFQKKNKPYGMRITEFMWTQPYWFQTFAAPKTQELQPDITAIIEKIELEAIVKVTKPNSVTTDLLNKITVRLQDDVTDFHLLTPETIMKNNKIIIKRTLYYQQFMQTIDKLTVTIKNLNNVKIEAKVIVQAWLTINQRSYNHTLLEKEFYLDAVPPQDILQICRKNEAGKLIEGETIPTIPTIIGTSIKSFN